MDHTLKAIRELLVNHQRFAILSHIRPDGDALGTSLAMAWCLKGLGKEVHVYNQDGLGNTYHFLPGSEWVEVTPASGVSPDWQLVAVDTSTYERLGPNLSQTGRVPDLNIDHHASNTNYGVINHVIGESPASAQVLAELMESIGLPLSKESAANLYVGLMTDTGSFRYRGTTARTFEIAAKLVAAGADPTHLSDQCYRRSTFPRFQLMKEILNVSTFHADNRVAGYRLTPELIAKTGAGTEEVENFLDILQTIETVEVAYMLQQMDGGSTRVSLRSRATVDVARLAAKFGGGGHKLAAGIRSTIPIDELESQLLREIIAELP